MIAVAAGLFAALPPKRLDLIATPSPERAAGVSSPTVIAGAFHVHTSRSDGTGTPDEIAAAAAQAGLHFVILTDHGNGTRQPDPPLYRHGVLCLDGVEISTEDGHYIAVGLPRAPYPLAGEGRDVVEDVKRLGGFGVVAHPDSPKSELRWRDWSAPFDAIEWLNADSEWRDETSTTLARALMTYSFRPVETLASLLDRPATTLERWDTLTARRRLVAIAGVDAHARIGWADDPEEPYKSRLFARLPGYQASFGSFSLHVDLDGPLTRDATADGQRLVEALKQGKLYTSIDGLAAPSVLDFVARSGRHTAREGGALQLDGPVAIDVRSNVPIGGSIALFENGRMITAAVGQTLHHQLPERSAVLRVEVRLPGMDSGPLPWIMTNPIYVARPMEVEVHRRAATGEQLLNLSTAGTSWRVEQSASSSLMLEELIDGLRGRYALGAGSDQFVTAAITAPMLVRASDRLSFRGSADRPMRVFVQLRRPTDGDGQRWRRSVYLDQQGRDVTIFFDEMTPIGRTDTFRPSLETITDVLFVVDTLNTPPGQSGSFSIEKLRVAR